MTWNGTTSRRIKEAFDAQGWNDLAAMIRSTNAEAAAGMIEELAKVARRAAVNDIVIDLTDFEEVTAVEVIQNNY